MPVAPNIEVRNVGSGPVNVNIYQDDEIQSTYPLASMAKQFFTVVGTRRIEVVDAEPTPPGP